MTQVKNSSTRAFRKALGGRSGFLARLDFWAHRVHAPKKVTNILCDAFDISLGMDDDDFGGFINKPSGLSWRLAGRSRWDHGRREREDPDMEDYGPPRPWPWFYRWHKGDPIRLRPWLGGDEWCRRTVVLSLPFIGSAVIPLWSCQDADCKACQLDCKPSGDFIF